MPAVWDDDLEGPDPAEVHWSASTILAIFFASSLISAVFFGLGYSFGRGGTAKPLNGMMLSPIHASAAPQSETASGLPASAMPEQTSVAPAHAPEPAMHATGIVASASNKRAIVNPAALRAEPIAARKPVTAAPEQKGKSAVGTTRYMVQVGAIGDHKDAQMLVSLLRRKGFHAGIYPAKRDRFLHVQIGPFATEAQAQTTRHRVLASGFHAILKQQS